MSLDFECESWSKVEFSDRPVGFDDDLAVWLILTTKTATTECFWDSRRSCRQTRFVVKIGGFDAGSPSKKISSPVATVTDEANYFHNSPKDSFHR